MSFRDKVRSRLHRWVDGVRMGRGGGGGVHGFDVSPLMSEGWERPPKRTGPSKRASMRSSRPSSRSWASRPTGEQSRGRTEDWASVPE